VVRSSLAVEDVRRGLPYAIGVGIRRGADALQRRSHLTEEEKHRSPADGGGLSAEGREDRSAEGRVLYPEEEAILGPNATARRRFYFALGRAAARDALADLGAAPVAIVGWQSNYAGLGVDLERLTPGLSARAERLVCTPAERAWIGDGVQTSRGTMLFSAKEAVFKALFPIEHVWLGFADAELAWQPEVCAFEARLLKRASGAYPVGAVLQVQCTLTDAEVLCTTHALPGG